MSPTKLLIVADEWEPMRVLAEFLEERRCTVDSFEEEDLPDDLSPYAAAFMYIHRVMDARVERMLIDYAENGGRLIVLHHGLASAKVQNPDWLRFAGIHIEPRDAPRYPWRVVGHVVHTVVNLNPGHYVTSHQVDYERIVDYRSSDAPSTPGPYPAFDLPDTEIFLNQHFTDGREKSVLFGFCCVDPDSGQTLMQDRGGWLKAVGKGRLFYLQPGHSQADFRNPALCQIIHNCLTWNSA